VCGKVLWICSVIDKFLRLCSGDYVLAALAHCWLSKYFDWKMVAAPSLHQMKNSFRNAFLSE
jgi:hypothetical protein